MAERLIKVNKAVKGIVVSQDETKTVLRLPVTRYGSPESKDLHGEFFHKGTYFGDNYITTKFGLYEHLLNPEVNPYAPEEIEAQVLGPASLVKAADAPDDMSRWWDFEIQRSNQYHDYVLKLNDMGMLGTSTQCFMGGKKSTATGQIDTWLESEVTITPTPADFHLVPQLADIAKSFGLPAPRTLKAMPLDVSVETPPVEVTADNLTQKMDEIIKAANLETTADEMTDDRKLLLQMAGMVKSQQQQMDHMKAWIFGSISIDAYPQEGESLTDVVEQIKQMVNGTGGESAKAFKALMDGQLQQTRFLASALKGVVTELVLQSPEELEADNMLVQMRKGANGRTNPGASATASGRNTANFPNNAPGGD